MTNKIMKNYISKNNRLVQPYRVFVRLVYIKIILGYKKSYQFLDFIST